MIYYKIDQESSCLIKYNVSFDKETLNEIKNELIINCSKRKHVVRESTLSSSELINNQLGEMSDLKVRKTDKTTSYCDTSEDKVVFEYDYIHVTYPYLAALITGLLCGDETAIYKIINYKIEYPTNYHELITQEFKEMEKIIDSNSKELLKRTENIKRLSEERILNENCLPTLSYFTRVIDAIRFEEIDRMSISSIIAYKNFFATENGSLDFDPVSIKLIFKKD